MTSIGRSPTRGRDAARLGTGSRVDSSGAASRLFQRSALGSHLVFDPLHGTGPYTETVCDLDHSSVALFQSVADCILDHGIDGPSYLLAGLFCFRSRAAKTLPKNCAFEVGENARHRKHSPAGGRRGIYLLFMEVQVNSQRMHFREKAN